MATILGIHGLGGLGSAYKGIQQDFRELGHNLQVKDLSGFGDNSSFAENGINKRGHVDSFHTWLGETQGRLKKTWKNKKRVLRKAKQILMSGNNSYTKIKRKINRLRKRKPRVIFGNSMGALIAASLEGLKASDRVILSVPGFAGGEAFNLKQILEGARNFIANRFRTDAPCIDLPNENSSADAPFKDQWTDKVSYNLLKELTRLQNHCLRAIERTLANVPVLFIQAKDDAMVDNKTQDRVMQSLVDRDPETNNKRMIVLDGPEARHAWTLYDNELRRSTVQQISNWIDNPQGAELKNEKVFKAQKRILPESLTRALAELKLTRILQQTAALI